MQIKLNHNSIKSLEIKDKRYTVSIEGHQGLLLKVKPNGEIDFVFRYQLKGKRRSMTIGHYPAKTLQELRAIYSERVKDVSNGIDPLESRQHQQQEIDPTLSEVAEQYFQNYAQRLRPSTAKEYRRMVDRYIFKKWPNVPNLATIKISSLRRRDVKLLVDYIANTMPNKYKCIKTIGAPTQANRCLAVLSGICQYAIELEYIEFNPAHGITKPGTTKARNRHLTMEEIKILINYLSQSTQTMHDAIMLTLYTGQRISQIASLRMDWIEDGWINFPAVIMKAGRPHTVFLCPAALEIIEQRERDNLTNEYVFPGRMGNPYIHSHSLRKGLSRMQEGLKNSGIKKPFSFHDFRRTLSTHLSKLGFGGIDDIILSHVVQGTTAKHYQRYDFKSEIVEALTTWCKLIQDTVSQPK